MNEFCDRFRIENAEIESAIQRSLGWHVISGERLLELLCRVANGELPDLVYAEEWANADHETVEPT